MSHNEHCQECKRVFLTTLEKQFGEVSQQWSSNWPCRIDDILDSPQLPHKTKQSLYKIYKALQDYRGHKDFVGVPKLPESDYYIKSLNCIVEFDESQHFTAPRALTLSLYPKGIKLGYDKKDWLKRCVEINRHDNDPIYRDETRAWYDALRDLVPIYFGMNPTVRIFSKQLVWCKSYMDTKSAIKDRIGKDKTMNNKAKRKIAKSIDFNLVERDHVKDAIENIKRGNLGSRKARSTVLDYNGKYYPAKYVLETAYEIATEKTISPDDHTGGNTSAKILDNLGFKIEKDGKQWKAPSVNIKKVLRIFLEGTYSKKLKQHNNDYKRFNRWVSKEGNMSFERMDAIFRELENQKMIVKKSVIVFPACTLVIRDDRNKKKWYRDLMKKSENSTIIMGILDQTTSNKNEEYSTVWHDGKYCELNPYEPERKLPVGNGWVYNSSSICKLLEEDHCNYGNPGRLCFDIGHGAYNSRYGFNTLRKISKDKEISIILTFWNKSIPSVSWIYRKGKQISHIIKPISTEYGDIIDQIDDSLVKRLLS